MAHASLEAYLGTSGFSYPEWKGSFYPEKLPNKEMLRHYASRLPTVEINNTFYRLPRQSVLEGWASQTPESFRFAVKASRRITHFKKLRDAADLVGYLLKGVAALGQRRGPLLFQLPPTMKADVPLLSEFLAQVRELDLTYGKGLSPLMPAFEFRHASWFDDSVFAALEAQGATLVAGDLDDAVKEPPLVRTAGFAYLRLRRTEYSPSDLESWAERLGGLGVSSVFAYFKHEEIGPQLAADLQALLDP